MGVLRGGSRGVRKGWLGSLDSVGWRLWRDAARVVPRVRQEGDRLVRRCIRWAFPGKLPGEVVRYRLQGQVVLVRVMPRVVPELRRLSALWVRLYHVQ